MVFTTFLRQSIKRKGLAYDVTRLWEKARTCLQGMRVASLIQ